MARPKKTKTAAKKGATLSAAQQNTEYEKFVRSIVEALLRADGLETVMVEHNKQVQGISRSHQIDVYWEYKLGGMLHRVVINCKRYKNTVEVTDVETLGGVLHDIPGVRGLIVTTLGFQKGAVDYAKVHQIGLKVIRAPQDDDWANRLRSVTIIMQVDTPELTSCEQPFQGHICREGEISSTARDRYVPAVFRLSSFVFRLSSFVFRLSSSVFVFVFRARPRARARARARLCSASERARARARARRRA